MLSFKIVTTARFYLVSILLSLAQIGWGLSFSLPSPGNIIVGEVQTARVEPGEDFSAIAAKFDVGYYEILEANPGVDPDTPPVGSILIIPTQYILPAELTANKMVINLAEMRLYYRPLNSKRVYIFPVGIGKEDWETPLGEMSIVSKKEKPNWVVPLSVYRFRELIGDKIAKVIPPGPANPLGSYALRLSRLQYLIHGTNAPAGVGRRSSAGCIRMYEADIKLLYYLVPLGAKVVIINQPYKAGWHKGRLYLEAHMPLFEQRVALAGDVKPAFAVVTAALQGRRVLVDWVEVAKIAREHLTIPRALT